MMQKRITSRMSKEDPFKHERYNRSYKANDYYWGVGIELETYLQFDTPNPMNAWAFIQIINENDTALITLQGYNQNTKII